MNKKLLVLLMTLILAFTGCSLTSSGSSGGGGSAKVYYTYPVLDDFKTLLTNALVEQGAAQGVSIELGKPCMTVDQQVEEIQNAAAAGYNIIICLPVDRATALQLEASANGLPMIFVNSQPDKDYLERDKYMYVGSYEVDAGRFQAEYVWNKLGKPSSLNLAIFRGEPAHNAAVGRTVSVKDYFKENGVSVNYVFDDTAYWSTDQAADAFEIFLKTGQPYDAVICNNDSMALGICQVMKAKHIDMEKIPVAGVDATVDGCQSILNGEMQFTVYQSADGQATQAIATAAALIKNGTAANVEGVTEDGLYVWVPFEPVTASNASNYMK